MSNEGNKHQALEYAVQGLQVFPVHWMREHGICLCGKADCSSPRKHSLTKDGCLCATDDQEQIERWWTSNPDANIGIATGRRSGPFVVHLDGEAGIEQFESRYGQFDVPTVATGGGGRHLWFAYPDDCDLSNGTRLHGLPVDVRGTGGYVLSPPSNHHSGGSCKWLQPVTGALPTIPENLREWILSSKPMTFIEDLEECPGVSEGNRNSTLAEYIGRHLAYGEPVTTIIDKAIDRGQRCR